MAKRCWRCGEKIDNPSIARVYLTTDRGIFDQLYEVRICPNCRESLGPDKRDQ